jgi:hypothetical protein
MAAVILFAQPQPTTQLGCWDDIVSGFRSIVGYTAWGDFILRSPVTGQFAILYAFEPELVPLSFYDDEAFKNEYLTAPQIQDHLIRPARLAAVEARLGPLAEGEVFIPEPYPFIGGLCEPESYAKGGVWTFIDLVGQLQGVGEDA